MDHRCHVWAGALSGYLEMLDKVQKRICRSVGSSFAASLEPLSHCRNKTSPILFSRYYFGRCLSELTQLFYFLILEGGLLVILMDCMIFLLPFLDVIRVSLLAVSFFAQLDWSFLPRKCFVLTYNLNGFNSRINRLSIYRFFLNRSPVCFNLFVLLFLITSRLVVSVQPFMGWIHGERPSGLRRCN